MIGLQHYLTIAAILFALSVAGIFINRRNVILLLMCIELMLLAVNFNFIAFSRYLGDETGQVFVFFILTVAAAEAAIGLAILVVLFRNRRLISPRTCRHGRYTRGGLVGSVELINDLDQTRACIDVEVFGDRWVTDAVFDAALVAIR